MPFNPSYNHLCMWLMSLFLDFDIRLVIASTDVDFFSSYHPTCHPRFTTQPSYGRHAERNRERIPRLLGLGTVHLSPTPRSFPGHKSTTVLFDTLDSSTITHKTSDPNSPRTRCFNESSPLYRAPSMPSALTSSITYEGSPQLIATSPK